MPRHTEPFEPPATEAAPDDVETRILDAVRTCWGFDALRPGQARAIRAGLEGRDSLVVMPTGGGKSLCYQAPPLIRGDTAVVVSPLISLMKDQVDGLLACGYPAVAFHSMMNAGELADAERALREGEARLAFVAPERLLTSRFMGLIDELGVRSFVIDEAHCVSHWGHDFRPEYRRLAELKRRFRGASLHAFTATATERVRDDIVEQLGLVDPDLMIGHPDRPNLTFRVVPRLRPLEQLSEIIARHENEAAIVYCISRKETERTADFLRQRGIAAAPYHAGLEARERKRVQDRFMTERLSVVVATVAFGMGVDRSDVRCVVHMAMPKSIEHYQQESGRAGRDGLEAECVLLYSAADAGKWRRLMSQSLIEAGVDPDESPSFRAQVEMLEHMHRFCSSMGCRHASIVRYFGHEPTHESGCGACDVCLGENEADPDGTVVAQKILSCVARVEQRFGAAHVVAILRGSNSEKITRWGHERLSTFGLLRDRSASAVQSAINQLVDQGLLERSPGEMPVLTLTRESRDVLRGQREVALLKPPGSAPKRSRGSAESWEGVDRDLFESLRALRRGIAEEQSVPPYVVFSDASLRDMARVKPTTPEAFLDVHGVGQAKLEKFGEAFVDRIRAHASERAG